MKRLRNSHANDSENLIVPAKIKIEPNLKQPAKIFKITKVDRKFSQSSLSSRSIDHESTANSGGSTSQRHANAPETTWSLEQIERLSPKEQYVYFQNQAYEIKQLRRKIRKCCQRRGKLLEAEILQTQEVLQSATFELDDQRLLVENLLRALREGQLAPNTLVYNHICTIVRNMLDIPVEHKGARFIQFQSKELAITEKESREYVQLPRDASVFRALVGQQAGEGDVQRKEVDWYLLMHSELLKKMTYAQFAGGMARLGKR